MDPDAVVIRSPYSSADAKNYRLELKSRVCIKFFPPIKLSFASRLRMKIVNASTTLRCETWRLESNARGSGERRRHRVENRPLTCHLGAEDGNRTRDPHLGKVFEFVHGVPASPLS